MNLPAFLIAVAVSSPTVQIPVCEMKYDTTNVHVPVAYFGNLTALNIYTMLSVAQEGKLSATGQKHLAAYALTLTDAFESLGQMWLNQVSISSEATKTCELNLAQTNKLLAIATGNCSQGKKPIKLPPKKFGGQLELIP